MHLTSGIRETSAEGRGSPNPSPWITGIITLKSRYGGGKCLVSFKQREAFRSLQTSVGLRSVLEQFIKGGSMSAEADLSYMVCISRSLST